MAAEKVTGSFSFHHFQLNENEAPIWIDENAIYFEICRPHSIKILTKYHSQTRHLVVLVFPFNEIHTESC